MMSEILDAAKFVWTILESGQPKVDIANTTVSPLPSGKARGDIPGPWQTASYTEHLQQRESLAGLMEALGFDPNLIAYDVTAVWDYNGQYLSDFHVSASGTVQPLSNLSIGVQTYDADFDGDVVTMKYDLICILSNIGSGSQRITIRALARGDGGGMSLGEN
jgi:hypothetical protein